MTGRGPIRGLNGTDGRCCVGLFGFVDVINCGLVRFRHDVNSTVAPRYCEQRSPSVVPAMNGASQTTSIDFAFMPMTMPFNESGTLPESCTIVTRSPSSKRWFCSR